MSSYHILKIYFFPTVMTYLLLALFYFNTETFLSYYPSLLIFFSFPHFMISYYIWWKKREGIKKEISIWLFPIVFWSCLVFFSLKENTKAIEYIIQAAYVYLIYHFIRQFYGVILWQSYSQNLLVTKLKKNFINYMLLSLGLFYWVSLQSKTTEMTLFYFKVSNFYFGSEVITWLFLNALISFMLFFLYDFYLWFKNKGKLNYFLPYLTIFAAYLWFYPGFSERLYWGLALPILHAIQYIPFWFKGTGFKLNEYKIYLFYTLSILAGYVAFRFLPLKLDQVFQRQDLGFVSLIVFFNTHHFVIDSKIWKLKKRKELFSKSS